VGISLIDFTVKKGYRMKIAINTFESGSMFLIIKTKKMDSIVSYTKDQREYLILRKCIK